MTKDGGPETAIKGDYAFPWVSPEMGCMCPGISTRDYVAAKVFTAALASAGNLGLMSDDNLDRALGQVARLSIRAANAFIAARETTQ